MGKQRLAVVTPLAISEECVLQIGAQQELGKEKVALET